MSEWLTIPGGMLLLAVLIQFRWLVLLSRRVILLSERLARLEGRAGITPDADQS